MVSLCTSVALKKKSFVTTHCNMEEFEHEIVDALFLATNSVELSVERCFEVAKNIAPRLMAAASKIINEQNEERGVPSL